MLTAEKLVGIQASGLGGSFHEIAARDYFDMGAETCLVPYINHQELITAFHRKQVDEAVIAVDNTISGRVVSAVSALNGLPRSVHVIGSKVVPIEQRLLYPKGVQESEITAVISQKPALDQCRDYILRREINVIECDDTLQAAELVSISGGRIDGYVVGAIASQMAGVTQGLEIGPVVNSRQDNATKFWRISRDNNWDVSGSHAAITFDLPANAPGSLLRAIQVISGELGYDITDIDSHLHPHSPGKRFFYAELFRPDNKNPKKIASSLLTHNIRSRLLGIYDSEELQIVGDDSSIIPPAIEHDNWVFRDGLLVSHNSSVLHVEASNQPKALLGILKSMSALNIDDLSRPTIPHGNNFSRGFYIVINPNSSYSHIRQVAQQIGDKGFTVSHFVYKNGKLEL